MYINPDFTQKIIQSYYAEWLIYRHTHQQAVYYAQGFAKSNTLAFTRIVLGD